MDGGRGGGGLGESVPSWNQLWGQVVGIQSQCSGSGSELEANPGVIWSTCWNLLSVFRVWMLGPSLGVLNLDVGIFIGVLGQDVGIYSGCSRFAMEAYPDASSTSVGIFSQYFESRCDLL